MRVRHEFRVLGYMAMPEHAHLLVSEPKTVVLAKAPQALKLSVAVKRIERPFWQARYCDFKVFTERKAAEKLNYMHRNPVKRGLVDESKDWDWSSCRHHLTGEREWLRLSLSGRPTGGVVVVRSPSSQKRDLGALASVVKG